MPRCFNHDYRSRCIYHITLKKAPGIPYFGDLAGDYPQVWIKKNLLGMIIEKRLRQISSLSPSLKLLQYCIMPDHVHILIFVTAPISLHLGQYISQMKIAVNHDYRIETGVDRSVFEEDYYDCILHKSRSLDTIYRYIQDNPRRLAIRRLHPEFFTRVNNLKIGDRTFQAYGNMHMLSNPFKEQVVVHRADTPEMFGKNKVRWLYVGGNGGVLVSPFISPAEKAVRAEAESLWARTILITHDAFPPRYKPSAHDFDLCTRGQLLIISFGHPTGTTLSRLNCMEMNELAERLARA